MSAQFTKLPASGSVRLISFDSAEVITGIVPNKYILIVRGEAPCLNMLVELSPLIYVKQPDYWGIEVVGSLPGGFCLPAIQSYTVSLPLDGILGKKGIEVIGSNKKLKIDVPPKGGGGGAYKKKPPTKKGAKRGGGLK